MFKKKHEILAWKTFQNVTFYKLKIIEKHFIETYKMWKLCNADRFDT